MEAGKISIITLSRLGTMSLIDEAGSKSDIVGEDFDALPSCFMNCETLLLISVLNRLCLC